jgi:hypothetical protein
MFLGHNKENRTYEIKLLSFLENNDNFLYCGMQCVKGGHKEISSILADQQRPPI